MAVVCVAEDRVGLKCEIAIGGLFLAELWLEARGERLAGVRD